MRKYIIGALAGAALMMGVQAGASGLLTGSKVAGSKDVKYNGKTIGQAAIINNSSYLPVRSVSEALGLQIDLSGGSINLSSEQQVVAPSEPSPSSPGQSTSSQQPMTTDQITSKISDLDKQISAYEDAIEKDKAFAKTDDPKNADYWNFFIPSLESALSDLKAQKNDLEAQLKALQGQ